MDMYAIKKIMESDDLVNRDITPLHLFESYIELKKLGVPVELYEKKGLWVIKCPQLGITTRILKDGSNTVVIDNAIGYEGYHWHYTSFDALTEAQLHGFINQIK